MSDDLIAFRRLENGEFNLGNTFVQSMGVCELEKCKDGKPLHSYSADDSNYCAQCARRQDAFPLDPDHPRFKRLGVQMRWLQWDGPERWCIGLFYYKESEHSFLPSIFERCQPPDAMALIKPSKKGKSWRVMIIPEAEWRQLNGSLWGAITAVSEQLSCPIHYRIYRDTEAGWDFDFAKDITVYRDKCVDGQDHSISQRRCTKCNRPLAWWDDPQYRPSKPVRR